MNRLYLVRHGENPANIIKQFSYRLVDYPLTEKGVLQAQQTAAYFKDKQIDEIYTSPLRRTIQTGEIIGASLGIMPRILENFREVNVGELEKIPPSKENWALHHRITEAWHHGEKDVRFPGGENYIEFWARYHAGLRLVLDGKDEKNILIVGHGMLFVHTLVDLCDNVTNLDDDLNIMHNCSITEVRVTISNGKLNGELVRWADHSHLWGEAADLVPGLPKDYFLN